MSLAVSCVEMYGRIRPLRASHAASNCFAASISACFLAGVSGT